MPRPRNTTEIVKLQKRWMRLLAYVKRVHAEMVRPMTNTQRKATVVICGRVINKLVCTFAVSDTITNKVLQDLNAGLMRMDKSEDILEVAKSEIEVIRLLAQDIGSKISGLSVDIEASKTYS